MHVSYYGGLSLNWIVIYIKKPKIKIRVTYEVNFFHILDFLFSDCLLFSKTGIFLLKVGQHSLRKKPANYPNKLS